MLEAYQRMRLLHSSQGCLFAVTGKINSRIMLKTLPGIFYISLFSQLFGVGQQISCQPSLRG